MKTKKASKTNTKSRIIFFVILFTYNLLLGLYLKDFFELSPMLVTLYLLSALPTLFFVLKIRSTLMRTIVFIVLFFVMIMSILGFAYCSRLLLIMTMVTTIAEVMYMQELEYEIRCRVFFAAIWKFLIGNRDKCLAFVRYYYSPYFQKYSAEKHRLRYQPLLDKFSPAFKDEANVWMILNHILNVMLDFAVKVHNGAMPDNDDYSEHVFRVIYRSIEQYFKNDQEQNNN